MSVLGGRGGRSDDWSTQHLRARARSSERLDAPLDPEEDRWLDEHLASCPACTSAAAEYATQRLELRALRDRVPHPPRDLWARTAASIEREARHRSLEPRGSSRRSSVGPYALLAGALVVAVVVGTLSASRLTIKQPTGTPGASAATIVANESASAGPTPLAVAKQEVEFLGRGGDGVLHLYTTKVSEVCPKSAGTCATTEPSEEQTIGPLSSPESVYGSGDAPLVVLGDGENGSSVFAVARPEPVTSATPSPERTASTATPTATARLSPSPGSATPTPPESAVPTSPSASPPVDTTPPDSTPSPSASPTPAGSVEIARGVEVVDTTAAYAADGSAFAFTALPADGSHGPDIYVWKVGDAKARAITSDHRSVFGSWAGDTLVGSTVVTSADGTTNEPAAFTLSAEGDANVTLPQTGLAWRPAVDPNQGSAVYWAGTLERTTDELGWATNEGRLVLGRWSVDGDTSGGPTATPLTGDQAAERAETTIAEGPLADWDARWDETGTRLAIWIADAKNPTRGSLSLYVVDPFDGRIDLENPPLHNQPALAGFSIADGRLAWAAPAGSSEKMSRVLILAWTNEGFGQVESAPGDFILVR
jgi:hypothetical protein